MEAGDTEAECRSQAQEFSSPCPGQIPASYKDLLPRFEVMLQKALQATSKQITDHLSRKICDLGHRTSEFKTYTADILTRATNLDLDLDAPREENRALANRIKDSENRSHRFNLSNRGVPEHVQDLPTTITALFQDLVLHLQVDRLEMDRVHRALTRWQPLGSPQDIVIRLQCL